MSLQQWCIGSAVALTITAISIWPTPADADRAWPEVVVAQAAGAVPSGTPSSAGVGNVPGTAANAAGAPGGTDVAANRDGYSYDPSGRRDPFTALIQSNQKGKADKTVPPLQRVGLTEVNLIGIIWGGFGYTAMVQTPDGKGYSVRRGTRVGPNNGVVTKISKKGIVVTERYTDIYGKEQEREHVKHLHTSEESE